MNQPPVDVLTLAHDHGIRVVFEERGEEISGMLVETGNETIIVVNARHHENRQSFAIARELAHAHLHPNSPTVYVDSYGILETCSRPKYDPGAERGRRVHA